MQGSPKRLALTPARDAESRSENHGVRVTAGFGMFFTQRAPCLFIVLPRFDGTGGTALIGWANYVDYNDYPLY